MKNNIKENHRQWRKRNPEKLREWGKQYNSRPDIKERARRQFVIREYGEGSPEHFDKQLEVQNGLCAICGKVLILPHRDHNHSTGGWRGVLCATCNLGLGYLEKSGWLQMAKAYLEKWGDLCQ